MTKYQAAKRRATWLATGVTVLTFLLFFLAILPAIGGRITAEQPVPTYRRWGAGSRTMTTNTELATVPPAETALSVFSTDQGLEPWLQQVRAEIDGFTPDVSTRKGREAIASMAYKVAQTKNALDGVGKKVSADLKLIPKKVDAERKRVWDKLEAWQEEVRRPLNEWQAREDARIDGHTQTLDWLADCLAQRDDLAIEQLRQQMGEVEAFEISAALDEFEADAARGKDKALAALRDQIARREKHEAELAAIAKFNAEQVERDAQAERDRIAKDAAERATREAEQRAQGERDAAAQRERDLELQAERAKRESLEAKQRAEQAERDAAEQKAQAERDRVATEQQAAQDRIDAAQRQAEAVAQAEAAERQRQVDEQARLDREAKAREADQANRIKVLTSIKKAFMSTGLTEVQARDVVNLIRKGEVPGVTITY